VEERKKEFPGVFKKKAMKHWRDVVEREGKGSLDGRAKKKRREEIQLCGKVSLFHVRKENISPEEKIKSGKVWRLPYKKQATVTSGKETQREKGRKKPHLAIKKIIHYRTMGKGRRSHTCLGANFLSCIWQRTTGNEGRPAGSEQPATVRKGEKKWVLAWGTFPHHIKRTDGEQPKGIGRSRDMGDEKVREEEAMLRISFCQRKRFPPFIQGRYRKGPLWEGKQQKKH